MGQIHYPPSHVPFYEALIVEHEALKARFDAFEKMVNALIEPPEEMTEATPVPTSILAEQVAVFGEGGDPEGTELTPVPTSEGESVDVPDSPDDLDEPEQTPVSGETNAAPSPITGSLSDLLSAPQPDGSGAAPDQDPE